MEVAVVLEPRRTAITRARSHLSPVARVLARMLQPRIASAALGAVALLLVAGADAAASCPASAPCQLGTPSGNECVIQADCTIDSAAPAGTSIDLGTRRLVVKSGKQISVTGAGILSVSAASILLETSAKLVSPGDGLGLQRVDLSADGDVTLESGSAVDVSSTAGSLQSLGVGGSISLYAATATIAGNLRAGGSGRDTYGGTVFVVTGGALAVSGLDVSGGDRAGGGDITLLADGSINATGAIKAQGADGGTVEFDSGGDVVTTNAATILVQATGPDGSGGSVDVSADGSITLAGDIDGDGQEDIPFDGDPAQSGGDGADFSADALNGGVTISANLDLSGAPSGTGGDFDVSADQDISISGKVLLRATGVFGYGADFVYVIAGRDTTISGQLDASSAGSGGSMEIDAGRKVLITGTGKVLADGATDADVGIGGQVYVEACTVEIAQGAVVSALGAGLFPDASNLVRASTSLILGGTVQAGRANRLDYRSAPGVQILPTAKLVPAGPVVACPDPFTTPPVGTCTFQDPNMACCGVDCPVTTTTSSSLPPTTLPPTTTTTLAPPPTTLPPTTTTTLALPPTTLPPTTTTTLAPPPTTTTAPATTTTTSTVVPATTTSTTSSTTTSIAESTTSTTVTEAPATTVTTTSSPGIVTTTLAAATTTTVGIPPPTTSTTLAPGAECLQQPGGLDAAACRVGTLAETVGTSGPDALGGKATAKRLTSMLSRADRFLVRAEGSAKPKVDLRKARQQLKAFARAVQRGLKRKRGAIEPELGEFILGLARDATNDVGVAQAKLR